MDSIECRAPFIAAFGRNKDELVEFKLVIERENILAMPSLNVAVHCCFASYYIYNISYPPDFSSILLFLEQSIYLFNVKPSQKLPLSVSVIIDSLKKL